MAVDILQWIREGDAHVSWGNLVSEHNGHKLVLTVMRDAMKFDQVSAMTWSRKVIDAEDLRDGVRMAVSAKEMQQIADMLFCMLPTPKILDLVWAAAGEDGTQLESVVNVKGKIVAISNIHDVHDALEAAIAKAGGDKGGFIEAVGKYWVLCNRVLQGKFGKDQAVNYAWFTKSHGNGPGVTRTINVWQTLGAMHNCEHYDPSQVIRLVYRMAKLLRAGSSTWEDVDLADVATDPELAPLISHEGVLKLTRLPCVPEPQPTTEADGTVVMPEIVIIGDMPDPQPLLDSLIA